MEYLDYAYMYLCDSIASTVNEPRIHYSKQSFNYNVDDEMDVAHKRYMQTEYGIIVEYDNHYRLRSCLYVDIRKHDDWVEYIYSGYHNSMSFLYELEKHVKNTYIL